MDYLKYSKNRKLEADRILKETNIFNKLKQFGKVKRVGSYSLNLMIKPDLDFVLKVRKSSEINKTIKLIKKEVGEIKNLSLKKTVDRTKLGLKGKSLHFYYYDKDIWGIDILVTTKDFKEYNKIKNKVINKINPKKKINILKLKYSFYKNKRLKNTSYSIYKSVLDENISNLKEFHNYLKNKNIFLKPHKAKA
ncbi:hypothetical protein J4423_04440 [Candidatus Pacearchaeota archaeon]|nr:hypothetical protein [Candidatus Pacearchaeota archaeon]